ncbi:MAG: PLDc N-terminal domain-containing protein [Lentisphaeria bacterium]|nr:PLDc N-terminal domain-containing protein [Lentisphaeria bacterium]
MYLHWFHIAAAVLLAVLDLLMILHILFTMRDDSERATLWLMAVILLPFVGIILYLIAGVSRLNTFGKRISSSVDRFIRERVAAEDQTLRQYRELIGQFEEPAPAGTGTMDFTATLTRLRKRDARTVPADPDDKPVLPLGATALNGNKIELFCDGTDTYPAMLDSIRSARKSINLQSFILADDLIGREILSALRERAEAGVNVKVLFDKFGSLKSSWFLHRCQSGRLPNLEIRPFSHSSLFTPWRIQLRNHRKLLIVDGITAFTGGLNISQENIRTKDHQGIHDFHCRVHGPIVGELQYAFLCDWFYATRSEPDDLFLREYFPLPGRQGNDTVRVVASGHGYFFEGTENVFFTAASTAQKSIWIVTPYFVPTHDFSKALRMASARGVDVRLIVPAINNHWYVKLASSSFYEPLLADGVRIFERQEVFSHAKAMLVDGRWAFLGSSNCDVRSFRLNFELDLLVESGDFPGILHQQMLAELRKSVEITAEWFHRRNPVRKLTESVCALLSPVL